MHLRVIRAASMTAALAQLRAELGEDAVILSTRRVAEGVEVAAASEPPEDEFGDGFVALPPLAPPVAEPPPPAPAPAPLIDAARAAALAWHGVPDVLHEGLADPDLAGALAHAYRFEKLPVGRVPLLLAGPPGAGKTLTIAKLAARLCMDGLRPMVITADGARAGAVEQLAAFTRLLDLDLVVAPHPATLAKAILRRDPARPVLIDGPGMDALDATEDEILRALAAASGATIALVLPANLDPHEAADIAHAHAEAGATHFVATRLDRARRLGAVLTAGTQLAIAEAGTGPGVADGLAAPDPKALADRLLQAALIGASA
jgi:flagellar biosynthesis protein FlhF